MAYKNFIGTSSHPSRDQKIDILVCCNKLNKQGKWTFEYLF